MTNLNTPKKFLIKKLKLLKSVFYKRDFYNYFEKTIHSLSEPIGGLNCLSAFKAYEKLNKKNIRVLIDGNGSDEIFGGYNHHIEAHYNSKKILQQILPKVLRKFFLKNIP